MLLSYTERCIRNFAAEFYEEPERWIPKAIFEERTWKFFAIDELIKFMKENPSYDTITATVLFRNRMLRYSDRAKSWETRHLFSVIYDVCSDVLDFLLTRKK